MDYKINLKKVSGSGVEIQGSSLAIVSKEDGNVYLTSKPYINKLFKLLGYKNLSVVKILEEYAGKTISSVGDISPYEIYIDDTTDSFIVTNPSSLNWVTAMLKFLGEGFTVESVRKSDLYYYWDQIIVSNRFGSKFALYVDLCDEYVRVCSIRYDNSGNLVGVVNEGKYEFSGGQDSFDSFKLSISGNLDILPYYTLTARLSIYEYVSLLSKLGYVGYSRKKKYYKEDSSEEIVGITGDLDYVLDEINDRSWIEQRIMESPGGETFYDACRLISLNLGDHMIWDFIKIYEDNQYEKSDMFLVSK